MRKMLPKLALIAAAMAPTAVLVIAFGVPWPVLVFLVALYLVIAAAVLNA